MEHEVDEVIRNLDDSKCPGPDGIDGITIKRLHKCFPKIWISLFNKCLVLGSFLKEWKKARVKAYTKIGQDQTPIRTRIPRHQLATNSKKMFRRVSD
jgi:hypothetical protein